MDADAKRLGNYRLLRVLGRGGMGSVHLAEDVTTGATVALKVLSTALAGDEAVLRRFELEQEALARVEHPGVVRALSGIRHTDGRIYFAMEYLDGRTLEAVLREEAPLTATRAVRLARQILAALAAAHDVGIVHRDVKPSNIVLLGSPPDETVKVLDFGLARLADATRLTNTGQVMGTLHYMSPEQCEGARALDARSDVYSAGAVVFEMLVGRPPFEADTPVSLLRSHVVTPAPDVGELRDDVPPELARLIADCLAKRADARPNGARAALERLEAVPAVGDTVRLRREAPTVAAFPVAPTVGLSQTDAGSVAPATTAPRRGVPWAIIAVAGVLLAVALAFALGRDRGRDDPGPAGATKNDHSAAVVHGLQQAIRDGDFPAFRAQLAPALADTLGGGPEGERRFVEALAGVDARDFKPGLVMGNVEGGRLAIVVNGAALPAALGLAAEEASNGVRLAIERHGDAWLVTSATPAMARSGDSDRARESADRAVRQAFRPPALLKTLDMAGVERSSVARRDAVAEFLRGVRSGERAPPRVQFDLDVAGFDATNGTWRVEVRLPELAEAMALPTSRIEVTLALTARRPGGRSEFRVVEARLLRD